jgi:hypothetical protein
MPDAVICLGSAAYFELLVPDPPSRPTLLVTGHLDPRPMSQAICNPIVGTDEDELVVGIVEDVMLGLTVRRTGPARTLVDLARDSRRRADDVGVIQAGRRFLDMGGDVEELFGIAHRLGTTARARGLLERIARAPERAGP